MELRPCGLSVFLTVIEAAVVDGNTHAGKCLQHIGRRDPILRIFRVIVITVNGQAVGGDEVFTVAVVVLVFGANIVMADSLSQVVRIHDDGLVRVGAVAGISGKISTIKCEHQSYTSPDSSSSTFVINFSARIMVSSSQSPPRVTSKPLQPYLSMKGVT